MIGIITFQAYWHKVGHAIINTVVVVDVDKKLEDIIADELAVLYRSDGRRLEGIMGTHEPAIARLHLDAFEQPWVDSVFRHSERALGY